MRTTHAFEMTAATISSRQQGEKSENHAILPNLVAERPLFPTASEKTLARDDSKLTEG